jgi:Tfp pilus assembly pilus retraction ATPase PilT
LGVCLNVYEGISVLAAIYKDEPYLLANALKAAIAHRLTTSMVTGQIVPLFEIYIPDRVGKQHLHDGKPAAIRAQMTKNNPTIYCSFNASLEHMVELKRVDFSEKESIRLAVIGMTDNEREEQIQRGKEGNA